MKKILIVLLAIPITFAISNYKAAHNAESHSNTTKSAILSEPSADATLKRTDKPVATIETQQTAQNAPAQPIKPAAWRVSYSPHSLVTVERINEALGVLQDMGMTKQGAAYTVGNFITESYLDPDRCTPDGELACGLAQWHPNRRTDMPAGLTAQLKWAVDTEMVRDRPQLRAALFDPNASVDTITTEFYRWERWGVQGARWTYAANVLAQIN